MTTEFAHSLSARRARFFHDTRAAKAADSLRWDAPDALAEAQLVEGGHRIRAVAESQNINLSDTQFALAMSHLRHHMSRLGHDGTAHLASNMQIIADSLRAAIGPALEPKRPTGDAKGSAENAIDPASNVTEIAKRLMVLGMQTSNAVGAGNGRASSAVFDSLKDESNPLYRDALNLAGKLEGMAWAANNRELLRLGPTAIQTLHDAGVKERSFNRLTKEAKFTADHAVTLAKRLHEDGKTPEEINKHFDVTSAASKAVCGNDAKMQKEFERNHIEIFTGATPEIRDAARGRMEKMLGPHRHDAAKRKDIEAYEKLQGVRKEEAANKANTAAKNAGADAMTDAELATWGAAEASDSKTSGGEAKEEATPETKKAAAPEPARPQTKQVAAAKPPAPPV